MADNHVLQWQPRYPMPDITCSALKHVVLPPPLLQKALLSRLIRGGSFHVALPRPPPSLHGIHPLHLSFPLAMLLVQAEEVSGHRLGGQES